MFDIGFSELMVIGIVALLVLGPERLPKVARTTGHLLGRLQRYVSDVKSDINREMQLDELKKLQEEARKSAMAFEGSVRSEVANVENGLSVKSAPATLGSGIDDTTVTTRVKAALLEDPGIKSLDISVVTSHGEVQLTGFVGKKAQILAAENIARAVPGVSGIKNELMLKK